MGIFTTESTEVTEKKTEEEGRGVGSGKEPSREELNRLTEAIIGGAIEVHRALGPGLLESAYEACLAHELAMRGLEIERQRALPVSYRGIQVDCGYRLDLVVAGLAVVELKAVDQLAPIHSAQLLSYLKLSRLPVGLLINFHVPILVQGVKRLLNT